MHTIYYIAYIPSPCCHLFPLQSGQEESGDSPVLSLREALQKIEKSGFMEYTLGGHSCTRPPSVTQGKADDMFEIVPENGNPLLWRATAIAHKQLKGVNCASYFTAAALDQSPLECVF